MRQEKYLKDVYPAELIYSEHYFATVFKKTEGIVSATFYALENEKDNIKDSTVQDEVRQTALGVLVSVSDTLAKRAHEIGDDAVRLAKELTKLASLIGVLVAAEHMHAAYGSMIIQEIQLLTRNLETYRHRKDSIPTNTSSFTSPRSTRPERPLHPDVITDSPPNQEKDTSSQKDRKEQIKNVLKEKGGVSIKDIASRISGTSEKSIQRDLNAMILSGEVQRHGERRWSVYSLAEAGSGS